MNLARNILLTFWFCLAGPFAFSQQYLKLIGRILAADTKEPVPFAAIGFPEKGLGTVCDEHGNFELKVPQELQNQSVCISALGYKQHCQPVAGFLKQNPTVLLKPAHIQLTTVEIRAISAEELVKGAIRRIPENYADKPVRYTLFQRQTEIINDQPAYIIESVNEGYRTDPKTDYQFSIKKARGMATSEKNEERMNDHWVNVWQVAAFDNTFAFQRPFLHPSKHKNYIYKFEGEALIGADTAYFISFAPKTKNNGKEVSGYSGKLLLHTKSLGIIQVEAKANQVFLYKYNNDLDAKLINKSCKCEIEYFDLNWKGTYKRIGSKWYLSSGFSEIKRKTKSANTSIPEISHLSKQLIATNVQTENAREIPEADRVKPFQNPYSKAPKDMNEEFWQHYNVLPLPEAFKALPPQ